METNRRTDGRTEATAVRPVTDCTSAQYSTQLGGTPYHSPKLHMGMRSSVDMRRGTYRQAGRQTDRHTHTYTRTAVIAILCTLRLAMPNAKCYKLLLQPIKLNWRHEQNFHTGDVPLALPSAPTPPNGSPRTALDTDTGHNIYHHHRVACPESNVAVPTRVLHT